MHRALTGACALAWCALLAAAPAPWPSAEQQLLHNARFWEAHQRGDLARLALKKLVAARPDRPEPLVELGELDLRLNDFQAATEVETELQRRFAGRAESADFATALRVATRDRLRLASVRRLLELHRTGEMRAELIRLFPAGPPGGALGIEYALLLARTPGGLAAARAYLSRLAAVHPGDPRYQLAIAQLMVRDPSTALAGVTLLEQLRRRDDVRSDDADQLLAAGLVQLGAGKAPEPILKAYLARNPADSELVALRRTQQRLVEERQLQSAADTAHVLPLLQRRVARDLATGAVPGAAQMAVRAWLERSQASLAARQERRASAELRAALSLQRAQEDMAIASARELDALGYPDEADALLAAAIQRSPGSDWLFETRVRGLIAAGDPGLALVLLHERPLRGKWTAPSRDALRSGALQARADAEAKAGRTDAAIAALEVAVRLTPRDPWLRYRLAGYYNARGEAGLGRELMAGGAAAAPDLAEMSYAQALYLSHLEAYGEALAALDRVPEPQRTEGMRSLYARMEVADARVAARRLVAAGELTAARARLLALEPLAAHSFERARDLAYAWIELGESEHGVALMEPYLAGSPKAEVLLAAAQVLNSAEDDTRLRPLLARLRAAGDLDAPGQAELRRLQRGFDLREVRASERRHDYAQAAHRLDELLALEPRDRTLRVARAELDLMAGRPAAARDRLASLTAEDPDDLDTRLSYVRALTDAGDLALARLQLQALEARLPSMDEELRLSLARRQLALAEPEKALASLGPQLATATPRADVLMLAGWAELAAGHARRARDFFVQAAARATGAEARAARRAIEDLDERLQSSVAGGLLAWHQPGDPGMSQLDWYALPSAWTFARDNGSRIIVRADAVELDAGHYASAVAVPLLGTLQVRGPGATPAANGRQSGVSPALAYESRTLNADVGTTPLGFLLPNVVGGIEWTPVWRTLDLTLGVARRAMTSSELSYAGLRDPGTGRSWGGVVRTGPYAGFGLYKEDYDVAGSVRLEELSGTHVQNNQLTAARGSASRRLYATAHVQVELGMTLTYWGYQHNLQNYTFGSGGYYSPHSYLSASVPLEAAGEWERWRYKVRVAPAFSVSRISDEPFYPEDPELQTQAARRPLPAGYATPVFAGYRSSGFGIAASLLAERQLSDALVVGVELSIDRTDYYHPTAFGLYLRHAFGSRPTAHSHILPLAPYNR